MYHRSITLVLSILLGTNLFASDRIVCDFSQGIPDDFTLVDNDRNIPTSGAAKFGFAVGVPWVQYYDATENNYVACSSSWYKPAGTADDWLILPSLNVHRGTVLKWKSKAVDAKYRDGYAVYLSIQGTSISSFNKSNPLFSVNADTTAWKEHRIDLSSFEGKTVNIAFVNNSTDKNRLFVDDVFAGEERTLALRCDLPYLIDSAHKYAVSGKVITEQAGTVKGFTVNYSFGADTHSLNFADVVLGKDSIFSFTFPDSISLPDGSADSLHVWVQHDGVTYDSTRSFVQSRTHYILAEEFTGTWCPWCVRGTVAMKKMNELHSDFIGVAVHSDHDPMTIAEYENAKNTFSNVSSKGYPDVILNRYLTIEGDPRDIEEMYNEAKQTTMDAAISVRAQWTADSKGLQVSTTSLFNKFYKNADIRIAYLLKEDSVHHPSDSRYCQLNAYSGDTTEIGGYEKLSSSISPSETYFMDVARCVKDDAFGVPSSFPQTIVAGQPYDCSYTLSLPDNVDKVKNLTLVVLILNHTNGVVMNANKLKLSDLNTTGISTEQIQPKLHIIADFPSLQLFSQSPINLVEVFNVAGVRVCAMQPYASQCKLTLPEKGLYIVRTTVCGKTLVREILF
jgi:hypothetical protein